MASELDRFANTGVRDQIARLCSDGTARNTTFIMPILADQLERGRSIDCIAHALAAWAYYLATIPIADQASDTAADAVRSLARTALDRPAAFLDVRAGCPPRATRDARLENAFTDAHQSIARHGALEALRRLRPRPR